MFGDFDALGHPIYYYPTINFGIQDPLPQQDPLASRADQIAQSVFPYPSSQHHVFSNQASFSWQQNSPLTQPTPTQQPVNIPFQKADEIPAQTASINIQELDVDQVFDNSFGPSVFDIPIETSFEMTEFWQQNDDYDLELSEAFQTYPSFSFGQIKSISQQKETEKQPPITEVFDEVEDEHAVFPFLPQDYLQQPIMQVRGQKRGQGLAEEKSQKKSRLNPEDVTSDSRQGNGDLQLLSNINLASPSIETTGSTPLTMKSFFDDIKNESEDPDNIKKIYNLIRKDIDAHPYRCGFRHRHEGLLKKVKNKEDLPKCIDEEYKDDFRTHSRFAILVNWRTIHKNDELSLAEYIAILIQPTKKGFIYQRYTNHLNTEKIQRLKRTIEDLGLGVHSQNQHETKGKYTEQNEIDQIIAGDQIYSRLTSSYDESDIRTRFHKLNRELIWCPQKKKM